jgi:hypothetical protein
MTEFEAALAVVPQKYRPDFVALIDEPSSLA